MTNDHQVPFMVPPMPEHFVPRNEEFKKLAKTVLSPQPGKSPAISTALVGSGGFGKTTLAKALCHNEQVRDYFSDGILWVTLGENPDLLSSLTTLYTELTNEPPAVLEAEYIERKLADVLHGRKCLIVIDDIWNEAHLRHFPQSDGSFVRLITTRNQDIAGDYAVLVDEMTGPESVKMLTSGLNPGKSHIESFRSMAKLLGEWPLQLELANAALRRRLRFGDTLEGALNYLNGIYGNFGVTAFDARNAEERNQAIERSLAASLETLKREEHKRLVELSIFPEDIAVPIYVISELWKLSAIETESQLQEFSSLSLIKLDLNTKTVHIHDVLRKAMQEKLKDLAEPHKRLISSWGDFQQLPHDYAWRWVGYHLLETGKRDELRKLLLDFGWMLAKLKTTDTVALLSDYDHFSGDKTMELIQSAIRLSSNALSRNCEHLAGQLCGRLAGFENEEIKDLVTTAKNWRRAIWLQPITATLTPPGGPLIRTLEAGSCVRAVSLTSEGSMVVSGSSEREIKFWDMDTGQEIRSCTFGRYLNHSIFSTVVTTEGKTAVLDSFDGNMLLVNLETGKTFALIGHAGYIHSIVVTTDGKKAVSGSDDKTIKFWNTKTGEEERTFIGHKGPVHAVTVTADGKTLVSSSYDKTIKVWSMETGQLVRTIKGHTDRVFTVAVTADCKRIISGSRDMSLRLWDLETGRELCTFKGHENTISTVAVTADGKKVVSGAVDGTIMLWDLETGRRICAFEGHTNPVNSIITTPDGKMAVSGSDDGTVKIWSLEVSESAHTPKGFTGMVRSITATADGKKAFSGSYDGIIKQWDLETGWEVRAIKGSVEEISSIAVSDDGKLVVAGSSDGLLILWNQETSEVRVIKGHADGINSVAVSADGKMAVSISYDDSIKLWDLETNQVVHTLKNHKYTANSVAIIRIDALLFSLFRNNIEQWNLSTGRKTHVVEGITEIGVSRAISITPDGKMAAVGSWDGTVELWSLETGRKIREFGSHTDSVKMGEFEGRKNSVTVIAMTPDGKLVVSVSDDKIVQLWNVETGKRVAEFVCDNHVGSIAITSKGLILCGDYLGYIHFLRLVAPGQPREH